MCYIEARLDTELNGKTLSNLNVGKDRNINVVELSGDVNAFDVVLATLHRIESASREAEDVANLIFEFCTCYCAYADVVATISHVSQVKTYLRLDCECTNCVLCE